MTFNKMNARQQAELDGVPSAKRYKSVMKDLRMTTGSALVSESNKIEMVLGRRIGSPSPEPEKRPIYNSLEANSLTSAKYFSPRNLHTSMKSKKENL